MDPDAVKSTLSNLAFGNVIAAAARDLQKVTDFPPKYSGAALRCRPAVAPRLVPPLDRGVLLGGS